MEQVTPEGGDGGGLDLSALLGSLGQEGKPDLSALLEMVKGTGQEGGGPGGGVDFASLLGMLGGIGGAAGGGEEKPMGPVPPPPPGGDGPGAGEGTPAFDPALLTTFSRAMRALREPDRNIQLLQALRPFLEPERQKKVDEAIKLLHLVKLAPLLQGLPLGGLPG